MENEMEMEPVLIPSVEEDVELLTELSVMAFHTDFLVGGEPEDGPPDYDSYEWHHKMYEEGNLFSYVKYGVLIGGAVLIRKDESELHIGRIFLDPIWFRKGLGLKLMELIESGNPDIHTFTLDTPAANIRTNSFYLKVGYSEVSRDDEVVSYRKER